MTSRIRGGPPLKGVSPTEAMEQGSEAGSIRDQVEDSLFGRKNRRLVDGDAEADAALARLDVYRKKLARLAQDREGDYTLLLADGPLITIAREGEIFVGTDFLATWAANFDAQVGALAHEIGHRPKRWAELRQSGRLSRVEGEELCRLEETRADMFAGYALSQLGLRYEPFIAYIEHVRAVYPHRIYFSIEVRVETIAEAFESGIRRATNMRKLFPEFARMALAKHDLGEG
jgi:hypothetical protein